MSIYKKFFTLSFVLLFYVFGFGISTTWAATFSGDIQIVPEGSGLTAIGYGSDDKMCTLSIQYAPVRPDGTINFDAIGSTSVTCTKGPGDDERSYPVYGEGHYEPGEGWVEGPITSWTTSVPNAGYERGRYFVGWRYAGNNIGGGRYSGSPYGDGSPIKSCFYQEYASLVDIGNNNTANYKGWGQPYTGNCMFEGYANTSWLKRILYAPSGTVIVSISMSLADDGDVTVVDGSTRAGSVPATPITVSISASPTTMTLPTNASTLTWSTGGSPDSCAATGAWSGTKSASGASEGRTSLTAGSYTYTITCSKAGTTDATASVTVNVSSQVCSVTNFSATPNPIVTGASTGSTSINSNVNCDTDIRRGSTSGTLESQPPSGNNNTAVSNVSNGTTFYLQKRGDTSSGGTLATITVNLSTPSTIGVSLSASPTSMTYPSNSSTLTWTTTGSPTSCTAGGSWSGSKSASGGSQGVSVASAGVYTYSVTCSKSGLADVSSTATITVNGVSPITVSFSASPSTMTSPSSQTTLNWSTTGNPDSCTATGAWSGSKNTTSGFEGRSGLSVGTYVYGLTCKKAGTTDYYKEVTVTVNPSSCNFDATGVTGQSPTNQYTSEVHANDTLNIYGAFGTQSEIDAASITYQPSGFPAPTTYRGPGQINIYPLSGTGTFNIEIRKNAGCATSISVPVISSPKIDVTLTANPSSIVAGNSTRLTWSTTGDPTSCTATNTGYGWSGGKSVYGGYTDISPPSNNSFGITCTRSDASPSTVSKSVSVTVTSATPSCDPSIIGTNQMVGCAYSGTSFNTLDVSAPSGPVISSPVPNSSSPLPSVSWGSNGPGTLKDNFSVRWKGKFNFSAGDYIFTTASDDGSRAYFEDSPGVYLVNDWSNHGIRSTPGPKVTLSSGVKTLVYEVYEATGGAGYGLSWQKQGNIPNVTISGNPTSGNSPLTTTLTWSTTGNPTSCTASGGWSGSKGLSGTSQVVSTSNTTYSLTCTNSYGGNTGSVTVTPSSTYSLEVFKTYGGYVKSTDTFINCGVACSKNYSSGASVTLTAYPDSSAWRFIGWQGDCSGTGSCVLTINSPKTVTALFSLKPLIYREF
ncbi:MAG: PA14 domain-containing protein [Candidatus Paceibacterota bacterium]